MHPRLISGYLAPLQSHCFCDSIILLLTTKEFHPVDCIYSFEMVVQFFSSLAPLYHHFPIFLCFLFFFSFIQINQKKCFHPLCLAPKLLRVPQEEQLLPLIYLLGSKEFKATFNVPERFVSDFIQCVFTNLCPAPYSLRLLPNKKCSDISLVSRRRQKWKCSPTQRKRRCKSLGCRMYDRCYLAHYLCWCASENRPECPVYLNLSSNRKDARYLHQLRLIFFAVVCNEKFKV